MKLSDIKNIAVLILLCSLSLTLTAFSAPAKAGAEQGLALAENTILPSLLPLLIIFFLIMKTGAGCLLTKLLGNITSKLFALPPSAGIAILFGFIGGYPTGALMTKELYDKRLIDAAQARRMMRFNICGGAGFVITAVGTATLNSQKAGLILFCSNILSCAVIGVITSIKHQRSYSSLMEFCNPMPLGEALCSSVNGAVQSILNITAFIVLFSAFYGIADLPDAVTPLLEITNGVCKNRIYSLPVTCAFLSFGGMCIHLQLLSIITSFGMKYFDFFVFRCLSALLSYGICRLFLSIFPLEKSVFSNISQHTANISTVNTALSIVIILGCFVMVADIFAKKRKV